jgi:hypothetical protein
LHAEIVVVDPDGRYVAELQLRSTWWVRRMTGALR